MSDDIVTRLRGEANRLRFVASGTSLVVVSPSLQDEAANEIERLRKEICEMDRSWDEIRKWNERLQAQVNLWMGAAERFAESDPKFDAWVYYFKARRNEQG